MQSSILARVCYRGSAYVGMLIAPTVLILELTVAYALVPWTCAQSARPAVFHVAIGTALLVTLFIAGAAGVDLARVPSAAKRERFQGQVSLAISSLVAL